MKTPLARLTLLLAVTLVFASPARSTFAPFIDTATGVGTLAAGILDLKVSDQDEPFKQNLATHTWVLTNAFPGDPAICKSIQLKNDGNRDGSLLSVDIDNTGSGGDPMAAEVLFESVLLDATNLLPMIADSDGRPGISVLDFENQGGVSGLDGLFANGGNSHSFGGCLKLSSAAPESIMGQTWLGTFSFTLHQ